MFSLVTITDFTVFLVPPLALYLSAVLGTSAKTENVLCLLTVKWFSSGIYMSNKDVNSQETGIQLYYITFTLSDKECQWLAFKAGQPLLRMQLICL